MEDLVLQKMKNIILDEMLKDINEQERNKQKLAMAQKKLENLKIEKSLIMRNNILREKQREIENLYQINSDLKYDIHQEETVHGLQLKKMKNGYDIKMQELQNSHEKTMHNLDLQSLNNQSDFQKTKNEIDLIN